MGGADIEGARALREFVSAERGRYSRVYLVDADGPVDVVLGLASSQDAVLLPADARSSASAPEIFRYGGRLSEVGDEMFLGEWGIELHDYVAAAFVQLIGPTVVAIVDEPGWCAFLDDADIARRTGVFPSMLLDPRVLLANRAALERPDEAEAPSAIRVRADGGFGVGMRGQVRGDLSTTPSDLDVPVPRDAALDEPLAGRSVESGRPPRGRLARYLRATDLLRMMRSSPGVVTISGFGWNVVDDGDADAEPRATDPFLLRTAEGFVLADVETRRRRALSPLTAAVVEVTQTSRSAELAVERLARRLSVSVPDARRLCGEAVATLGVGFGIPLAERQPAARGTGR